MGSHPNPNPHKKCPQHGLQRAFFISPDTAAWQIWQHSPLDTEAATTSISRDPPWLQTEAPLATLHLAAVVFIYSPQDAEAGCSALLSCMHMSLQFHRNYAEQVHGLIGICNPPAQQK